MCFIPRFFKVWTDFFRSTKKKGGNVEKVVEQRLVWDVTQPIFLFKILGVDKMYPLKIKVRYFCIFLDYL